MSARRTMILLEDVSLEFPRSKLTIATFARKLGLGARREPTYTALSNISLEVKEGEVVGLIGRNGAGKSTLMRVIAGIYRPDRGRAMAAGRVSLLASAGVGFNPNLSGRDNVYLSGSVLGQSRAVMASHMDDIVEFAELGDFIDEPVRTYSSGMRSRLGFSIQSSLRPEILLMDEAMSAGDAEFKARCSQRMSEMLDGASTVIFASHSAAELKRVCTRCILVERGRITRDGPTAEVVDWYFGEAERKAAERELARAEAAAARAVARAAFEEARARGVAMYAEKKRRRLAKQAAREAASAAKAAARGADAAPATEDGARPDDDKAAG